MRDDCGWIQTVSGGQFWPLDPRAEDVCILDIAHALAMKCRFTGHCLRFYSVAQHSVIVSHLMEEAASKEGLGICDAQSWALWGLMHDAAEAYLPDVASPVKRMIPEFRTIEDRILRCVAEQFSLPWPMPAQLKQADLVALATERRDMMPLPPRPWRSVENVEPMPHSIEAYDVLTARAIFLDRFQDLVDGMAAS